MSAKRIVIAGGSGFIGTALAKEFAGRGYEVIVLTRRSRVRRDGVREVVWDGEHPGDWIPFLDGAEAVVNLTGRSINCPHTPENLREIIASRVNSVNAIAAAISQVKLRHASGCRRARLVFTATRKIICARKILPSVTTRSPTSVSGGKTLSIPPLRPKRGA